MKHLILSAAVMAAITLTNCKEAPKESVEVEKEAPIEASKEMAMADVSFGVRGNCGMCKSTIEEAAGKVDGVAKASWDVDQKKIDVSFDESKTDVLAIHKAIAASGYDTEKMPGDEAAYNELPGCCKYDHDMEMNQDGSTEE